MMSVTGMPQDAESQVAEGRWPPNILLTHSDCQPAGCADDCPVAGLDAQSGTLTSGTGAVKHASAKGGTKSASIGAENRPEGMPMLCYGDTGGASRFFPQFAWDPDYDFPFMYCAKASPSERPKVDGIAHPTCKPVALMRWLVRLVTPPGGIVLDPFAGSGTTGEACRQEMMKYVLIEREPDYIRLIHARLAQGSLFDEELPWNPGYSASS
jgi:hypothetical protein